MDIDKVMVIMIDKRLGIVFCRILRILEGLVILIWLIVVIVIFGITKMVI